MARDDPHFRLRIPENLKAAVEIAAAENNRSLNAEIIHRLSLTFERTSQESVVEVVQLKPIGVSRANAAALLGLTPENFDLLVENGTLPPPRLIGSQEIWSREQLEYLGSRMVQIDIFGNEPAADPSDRARREKVQEALPQYWKQQLIERGERQLGRRSPEEAAAEYKAGKERIEKVKERNQAKRAKAAAAKKQAS
jgi:hypothetical protein